MTNQRRTNVLRSLAFASMLGVMPIGLDAALEQSPSPPFWRPHSLSPKPKRRPLAERQERRRKRQQRGR